MPSKLFQLVLLIILVVTLSVNIVFIMDTRVKLYRVSQYVVRESRDEDLSLPSSHRSSLSHVSDESSSSRRRVLKAEVLSSRSRVTVIINGATILDDTEENVNRGVHVLVLNEISGSVMAQLVFDTYSPNEDSAMVDFLSHITDGRILIFAIKDEGSFHLTKETRRYLKALGGEQADFLGWRDTWALITVKAGAPIAEMHSLCADVASWAEPTLLTTELRLMPADTESSCNWPHSDTNVRRAAFCKQFEGYGDVCSCTNPAPLHEHSAPLAENFVSEIPVIVIASDRPHYLFRMLRSLLSANSVNSSMITVFIDGYFEAPMAVTRLFGLRGIQHTPLGVKNSRISQHYRASLTATFNLFQDAQYAIVLEEDLDVSSDFFSYFSQTKRLLDEDETLYCISAWNDQGYNHSVHDPSLLYRVETMPGLGWMLTRRLYKDELEPIWPTSEKRWDWDMWMRTPPVRRDRECVVPDVSRTYHFGSKGINMNTYFQEVYFKRHAINTVPNVRLKNVDSLKSAAYEDLVNALLSSALVLNRGWNQFSCDDNFIPNTHEKTYVLYIRMENSGDFATWKLLAKCFHLWDLDVRGVHKGMWRFFMKTNHIMVVGSPASPYSRHLPSNIVPLHLLPTTDDN